MPHLKLGSRRVRFDLRDLPPIPSNDRPLIQAWADSLGLGSWIRWIPYAA
jgi:hypothetical protein